ALRLLPPARHEAPLLQAPQRRVQRALLQVEEAVRTVPQFVQNLEPVLLLLRQEREEAELDGALLQFRGPLRGDFRHPVRLVFEGRYFGFRSWAVRAIRVQAWSCIPPRIRIMGGRKWRGSRSALAPRLPSEVQGRSHGHDDD